MSRTITLRGFRFVNASLGAQVSGIRWKRPDDRLGVAYGVNGLADPHKDYLEAGGTLPTLPMLLHIGALPRSSVFI